ncbi:MAG: ParB/RepB/Spo0J family partition protein [Planctomycetota bacterium]
MSERNEIKVIRLDRLVEHPDNANVQSKVTFGKLVRNIERTGLYEPLVVRPMPGKDGYYQVINGNLRKRALEKLEYKECDCIVWDIDDEATDLLLLTLNRLGGKDQLDKKLNLLRRLNKNCGSKKLGKLLPQSMKQIERLVKLKSEVVALKDESKNFAKAAVFFVDEEQESVVEEAVLRANKGEKGLSRAVRRGAALAEIANNYIQSVKKSL